METGLFQQDRYIAHVLFRVLPLPQGLDLSDIVFASALGDTYGGDGTFGNNLSLLHLRGSGYTQLYICHNKIKICFAAAKAAWIGHFKTTVLSKARA